MLLASGWACVDFASDISNAGDAWPINLMGVPLFTVRGVAGAINLFHNICSHHVHRWVNRRFAAYETTT